MAQSTRRGEQFPEGRPLKWTDVSKQGKEVYEGNLAEAGRNAPAQVQANITRATAKAANPKVKAEGRRQAQVEVNTMEKIAPHVESKAITMDGAIARRVGHFKDAVAASPSGSLPAGTTWYPDHNRDLAASAAEHGNSTSQVISASAAMSPQNSPDFEKHAVHAIQGALHHGMVHVSQFVADHLASKGIPVEPHQIGRTVPFTELHPHAMARLASPTVRGKVETNADLNGIAKGGTNVTDGIDVMTGRKSPADVFDPHSAPKITSYESSIQNAHSVPTAQRSFPGVPQGQEHHLPSVYNAPRLTDHESELRARVAGVSDILRGDQFKGQGSLDLFGLQHSHEGILNPKGDTAEDTWMHSITAGQPNVTIPGTKTNVTKTVGSMNGVYNAAAKRGPDKSGEIASAHSSADIGPVALQHAFNNHATIRAAAQVTRETGVNYDLPANTMQAVPWTQVRRVTGKDSAYNQQQAAAAKADRASARTQKAADKAEKAKQGKQGTLF